MKSTPTPHVATAVTVAEMSMKFGPSGSRILHDIVVPAGTRCRKLVGGSEPWVVSDISFIDDKQSLRYFDADIYGIRVPEDNLTDVVPV